MEVNKMVRTRSLCASIQCLRPIPRRPSAFGVSGAIGAALLLTSDRARMVYTTSDTPHDLHVRRIALYFPPPASTHWSCWHGFPPGTPGWVVNASAGCQLSPRRPIFASYVRFPGQSTRGNRRRAHLIERPRRRLRNRRRASLHPRSSSPSCISGISDTHPECHVAASIDAACGAPWRQKLAPGVKRIETLRAPLTLSAASHTLIIPVMTRIADGRRRASPLRAARLPRERIRLWWRAHLGWT
jgi:hypothetical protein